MAAPKIKTVDQWAKNKPPHEEPSRLMGQNKSELQKRSQSYDITPDGSKSELLVYADKAKNSYPIAFGSQDSRVDIAKSRIPSENARTFETGSPLKIMPREEVSNEMLTEFET
jgi:hypothetical protein